MIMNAGHSSRLVVFDFGVMSLVKSKLKSAREALSKKDYAAAKVSALKALDYEPENYNAYATRPMHLPPDYPEILEMCS